MRCTTSPWAIGNEILENLGEGDVQGDVRPDDGSCQHPHERRPTMNTNHPDRLRTTHRTATIHPITSHPSGPRSSPTRPDDGDVDNTGTASSATERLVLTVDEAAYLLNISRGLAYELVARGELPAVRLGRRIVIPRVVLEELLGTAIR